MLEPIYFGEGILDTVDVKMFSFFVISENIFVGRPVFPFPDTERKHKTKETHLTTPAREKQRRQCGSAAVPGSARRPSSQLKSSEVHSGDEMTAGEGTGF